MSVVDGFFIFFLAIISASSLVSLFFLYSLPVSTQFTIRSVSSFVAARGDQPSNLAILWDSMVDRVMGKVTMGHLGTKSGEARREKSAEIDFIKALVSADQPVIAALLDQFVPKWGKMIQNNPNMLPHLMEFVNKKSGQQEPAKVGSNGSQIKFPL